MRIALHVLVGLLWLALAACGGEEEAPKPDAAAPAEAPLNLSYQEITTPSASYPSKTCVVTGKELGPGRYAIAYKGYEMQFCSKDCLREFAKNPDTYVYKVHPRAWMGAASQHK
jgi:YHS domain-containing protein